MRRFLLILLLCAISLVDQRSAWALPSESVFTIMVPDGPDFINGTSVGTIYFELDAEERGSCRYYGAWDDATGGSFEAACYLAESKTRGHASCSANSRTSFGTMVSLDARFSCWGFDTFARPQQLFMLAGLELPEPGGVIGMLQWTAATPMVSPFHAQPYP